MFRNRTDAGQQLAKALSRYKNKNALVIAIPRGGVEIGFHVAKELNADLFLIISRKLGMPLNPEAAFGAITEDGLIYLSEYAEYEMDPETISEVVEKEKIELNRRIQLLRNGAPLPDMEHRTVIIVDDGIATGATLLSAIMLCDHKNAKELIVAAPVADQSMKDFLADYVDDVIIVETPKYYHAVSQVYEDFKNLTDEQVIEIMNNWEIIKNKNRTSNGI